MAGRYRVDPDFPSGTSCISLFYKLTRLVAEQSRLWEVGTGLWAAFVSDAFGLAETQKGCLALASQPFCIRFIQRNTRFAHPYAKLVFRCTSYFTTFTLSFGSRSISILNGSMPALSGFPVTVKVSD